MKKGIYWEYDKGYFVPNDLLGEIPMEWRKYNALYSGSENWYEKDFCWAFVVLTFADLFSLELTVEAQKTLNFLKAANYIKE